MAAYDLEEQEQISQIKAWWETYGNLVTGVALVAAVAAVGWQGWTWYQGKQSGEASVLYAAVQKAAAENKPQQVREAAGMLIEKYSGTAYADLGALLASRVQADAGDLKNARAQLGWAAEKANDPVLRELARLRLAPRRSSSTRPSRSPRDCGRRGASRRGSWCARARRGCGSGPSSASPCSRHCAGR